MGSAVYIAKRRTSGLMPASRGCQKSQNQEDFNEGILRRTDSQDNERRLKAENKITGWIRAGRRYDLFCLDGQLRYIT